MSGPMGSESAGGLTETLAVGLLVRLFAAWYYNRRSETNLRVLAGLLSHLRPPIACVPVSQGLPRAISR